MRYTVLFAPVIALVLSACNSPDKAPPLEGKRLSILVERLDLAVHPEAERYPLDIGPALRNSRWVQLGGTPDHAPGHLYLPEAVGRAWTKSLGAQGDATVMNPPVVDGERVFSKIGKDRVVALDMQSGKEIWNTKLKLKEDDQAGVSGGLAVSSGKVIATTATGEIIALNTENGEEVWRTDVQSPLRVAPAVTEDKIYALSYDNRLFALNAEDGLLQWTHTGLPESLAVLGGSPPAISGDFVVAPYSSGEVFVLDAKDGSYIWHDALPRQKASGRFNRLTDINAAPVTADGVLYAVGSSGLLTAYKVFDGSRLWSVPINTSQTPWVAGSMIYVLTDEGNLVGINRTGGRVRFITDLNREVPSRAEDPRRWHGPVLAGGRLMVASSDGYALSLSPTDGALLKAAKLPAGAATMPVVAGSALYFLLNDGRLIQFR